MMGSSFNRLLEGRRRGHDQGPGHPRHRPRRLRGGAVLLDAVARDRGPLALAAVPVALCFRDPARDGAGGPTSSSGPRRAVARGGCRPGPSPSAVRRRPPRPACDHAGPGRDVRRPHPRPRQRARVHGQRAGGGGPLPHRGRGRLRPGRPRRHGPAGRGLAGPARSRAAPSSASTSKPAGADNPVLDEFRLIGEDGRWPLDDASVDLAVSDFVLEHVTDPEDFVRELARVLRPGGVFIARTISRDSVLAAAARIVPNDRHAGALGHLQPGRRNATCSAPPTR